MRQAEDLVLHAEFQTEPDSEIPFRMADYRLRVYRRFPRKEMRQVVIYLRETGSALVRQNAFVLTRTRHEFDVIRLWEQPPEIFLSSPGLLPFAALSRTEDPVGVLTQVRFALAQITDKRSQSNWHHRAQTGKLYESAKTFIPQAFQRYLFSFTRKGRKLSKPLACNKNSKYNHQ